MRPIHLAFLAILATGLPATAQQAARDKEESDKQGSNAEQGQKQGGNDASSPDSDLDLRFRHRETTRPTRRTIRDHWIARATSRIPIDSDWKLSLLAQGMFVDQTRFREDETERRVGLGNSLFQADLIHKLTDRVSVNFGSWLGAPTAQRELGGGRWLVIPDFGVRYTFKELSDDTYFAPVMRYAITVARDSMRRNINEPQIAGNLRIGLPESWFVTFYPSYDIRINYGDPVPGQTGRLFLPADAALGYSLTDKISLSLEGSVPIIKDYPLYDFKTEFRVVIKY